MFVHEGIHATHGTVVGHGDSRLVERFDLSNHRLDLICTLEQVELGEVSVDERQRHGEVR